MEGQIPGVPRLYVCGSRGSRSVSGQAYSEFGGLTSCYIFKIDDYAVVVDVGTGLENAAPILADCTKIDVVLTHFHYDHILGLLNPFVFPEGIKPRFYSYSEGKTSQEQLDELICPPFWPKFDALGKFDFIQITPGDSFQLEKGIFVETIASHHLSPTILYKFNYQGHFLCVISDYEHGACDKEIKEFVEGACVLLYDGMFNSEEYPSFEGWGHSTWEKGVELASEANVKHLLITHHNPVHADPELLEKEEDARKTFSSTRFARMGDEFNLIPGQPMFS